MNDVVHLVAAVICIRSNLSKVSRNVRRRPNPGVAHTVIAEHCAEICVAETDDHSSDPEAERQADLCVLTPGLLQQHPLLPCRASSPPPTVCVYRTYVRAH